MNSRIRITIITLIAAGSFATATVAPAISQAQPVKGSPGAKCATRDPYTGEYKEVDEGTLAINAAGDVVECKGGEWKKVAGIVKAKPPVVKFAGSLTAARSIA
jgi:hypothetical protein